MFQILEVEANDITQTKRTAQWKISDKLLKLELSGTSQIHMIKNPLLLLFQHLRKNTEMPCKSNWQYRSSDREDS